MKASLACFAKSAKSLPLQWSLPKTFLKRKVKALHLLRDQEFGLHGFKELWQFLECHFIFLVLCHWACLKPVNPLGWKGVAGTPCNHQVNVLWCCNTWCFAVRVICTCCSTLLFFNGAKPVGWKLLRKIQVDKGFARLQLGVRSTHHIVVQAQLLPKGNSEMAHHGDLPHNICPQITNQSHSQQQALWLLLITL